MSIKVNVYNQKAEPVGEFKLSDKIFGVKVNEALVHQAAVTQMANERQVLAHTKDRSEVRGGGRKPWRQKGTGRARAGSTRSPIWTGGGVTFGPRKTRNFKKKINKKMKQKAMFMVLADKVVNNNLIILEKLTIDEFKTKIFGKILTSLEKVIGQAKRSDRALAVDSGQAKKKKKKKPRYSVLVVSEKTDKKLKYSGRNLVGAKIINLGNINILDLLKYKNLILTKEAVKKIESKK